MPIVAAGIAAGGSLLGGLIGKKGQQQTNVANAQQAQLDRDFQERMSSTAHQREVKDLVAAGLNPILSAGGPGASTPGGAMATFGNPGEFMGRGVAGAGEAVARIPQMKLANEQINVAKATQNKLNSEAAVNAAQIPQIQASTEQSVASAGQLRQATEESKSRVQQIAADIALAHATTDKAVADAAYQRVAIQLGQLDFKTRTATYDAIVSAAKSDAEAKALGLPAKRNDAQVQESVGPLANVGYGVGAAMTVGTAIADTVKTWIQEGAKMFSGGSNRTRSVGYGR